MGIHRLRHAFLAALCADARISYGEKMQMSGLFALIRRQHPAFSDVGPRQDDLNKILGAMSTIMDAMNPIRNEGSMAHPNKDLLDPPEAALVINIARTILHYVDTRVAAGEM